MSDIYKIINSVKQCSLYVNNLDTQFDLINELRVNLNGYKSEYILSINEYCIRPLTKRAKTIKKLLTKFNSVCGSLSKENKGYYEPLMSINPDHIIDMLMDDLTHISTTYNFDIDENKIRKAYKKA